jgi:glutaminyl-peptide cyclotransferase
MVLRHRTNLPRYARAMRVRIAAVLACGLAVVAICVASCGGDQGSADEEGSGAGTGSFDAERAFADLEAQVEIGPRPAGSPESRETANLIAERLRQAGAEDVRIQRPYLNVVGTIPGRGPGAVVVGAHHDTKDGISSDFVGANHGASGVAVVLELARALEPPLPGPSLHLVLFDAEEARGDRPFEEDGTRGSRQYVEYADRGGLQGSPPLEEIRAMVLFDMVGDCDLQIPRDAYSDRALYSRFAAAAEATGESGGPAPFEGETGGILDDHIPFIGAGIPAVDLIDFTYGPGGSPGAYWHTSEDTLDKVCPESLDAVGEAAVVAIPRIR